MIKNTFPTEVAFNWLFSGYFILHLQLIDLWVAKLFRQKNISFLVNLVSSKAIKPSRVAKNKILHVRN